MTTEYVKVPGTILFRAITVLLNVVMLAAIFWVRSEIKNEIRNELRGYMTVKQFEDAQRGHDMLQGELIKRLDRIETKVDKLMDRKPGS